MSNTNVNKSVEQFNQKLDDVLQHKHEIVEEDSEHQVLLVLAKDLHDTDFSPESAIRYGLRQRLLNELSNHNRQYRTATARPRVSLTWLVAIFMVVVAATILMSIQSYESPPYASLIRQPENSATPDSVFLTITPVVGDANATQTAMPPRTPAPTREMIVVPADEIFTTFYISRWPIEPYQVVVIATQDIPANTVLEADMLAEVLIPVEVAPEWGYSSVELLVGIRVTQDIPRWSPIGGISTELGSLPLEIPFEPSHVAVAIAPDAAIMSDLSELNEGDGFGIVGSFLYIDIDAQFQEGLVVVTPPSESGLENGSIIVGTPTAGLDTAPRLVTQEIIGDGMIVWNGYQRDPEGCRRAPLVVNDATGEEIPVVSPAHYPCLIIVSMPPQEAVVFTWALDSKIQLTVTTQNSD